MAVKFANNASSTLLTAINSTQTTIQVVNPLSFPTVSSPNWFYATISAGGISEIVKVTATNVQTFSCVRGADGSTPQSFPAGATIELRMVRGALQDIQAVPLTKSITIEAPGAAENIGFFYTPVAITLSQVVTSVRGTNPLVTWQLQHATSRTGSGVAAAFGTTTSSLVVASTAQIPAGSFVWITTSAMSGAVLEFQMTVRYSPD